MLRSGTLTSCFLSWYVRPVRPWEVLVNDATLLRKLVKDGMAKEKKDSFILCAGDQVAECIASVSKGQLRRMGLLSTSARGKIEEKFANPSSILYSCTNFQTQIGCILVFTQMDMFGKCPRKKIWYKERSIWIRPIKHWKNSYILHIFHHSFADTKLMSGEPQGCAVICYNVYFLLLLSLALSTVLLLLLLYLRFDNVYIQYLCIYIYMYHCLKYRMKPAHSHSDCLASPFSRYPPVISEFAIYLLGMASQVENNQKY